jgi:hypothetical protein
MQHRPALDTFHGSESACLVPYIRLLTIRYRSPLLHLRRKQGQASQLTEDRREKLEQLGFAWQVRNRPEWDHRYKQLIEYKQVQGDCKVPQHYKENRALGKWVAKQREQFKLMKKGQHSFLTPYRLEKLEQVGFSWHLRTSLDPDDAGDFPINDAEAPVKELEPVKLENVMPEPQTEADTMDV